MFNHSQLDQLYGGKGVTVVGDSMGRELFYGIADGLTKRKQDLKNKKDIQWKIGSGRFPDEDHVTQPVRLELYRPNFAYLAAHSFDGIYYKCVIDREYDKGDLIHLQSLRAINSICDRRDQDSNFFFTCPLSQVPANAHMYIANAAAWEHRALWGIYGFDWDMRDWERYKEDEYTPHGMDDTMTRLTQSINVRYICVYDYSMGWYDK
jgi:hypothetical protein